MGAPLDRSMSKFLSENYGSPKKQPLKKAKPTLEKKVDAILTHLATQKIKAQISQNGSWGGAKWPAGLSQSGNSQYISHYETRQNGRSAFHDSSQARTLITRRTDITVGVGLKVEPTPAWDVLGITDEAFKEQWVSDHETRFDMYMKSKECHRSESLTGYQIQRLWSLFSNRDNDQFLRFFYTGSSQYASPVQVEFVDPNQIGGYAYTNTYGYQDWQDGIKRDTQGRETAYKIRVMTRKPDGTLTGIDEVTIPAWGAKSKRRFMLHGYRQEYAGQVRGYSPLHFCIQELENLTDFASAELKKAINQSSLVGFVEPGENNPASNPFPFTGTSGPTIGSNLAPDPPVTTITDSGTEYECRSMPEFANMVPGSAFITTLSEAEKIKFLQNTSPTSTYEAFVTNIFTYLSAAYSMPMEVVLMKFNANYSASRAALLEAWRTAGIEQAEIKADLMDAWYLAWLQEEIASGRSQCPGWSDPRLRQAWLQFTLRGPALPSISPRDDFAAFEVGLKTSMIAIDTAARQANGSDIKTNIIKNKRYFDEMPIPYWERKNAESTPESSIRKPGQGSSDYEQ